jgi:uncharacterized protein YeaO (DUF488 family)
MLKTKRIYEGIDPNDGVRFLVERLWPRGIKKEKLNLTAWLKDVAPSADLRKWYQHDVSKWNEFQRRYVVELEGNPIGWKPIIETMKKGNVTLLYSAHDTEHNSAIVLKSFLERQLPNK